MTESPHTEDNNSRQEHDASMPPQLPPPDSFWLNRRDKNPDKIKEKFLAVAKEKDQLDAVVLQQSDMIKKLEKEKNTLSQSLETLTESYNKMQELLMSDRSRADRKDLQYSDLPERLSADKAPDKQTDVMKEKFLAVAKEKDHLESLILQQSDMIKKLEKEKNTLSQSLETFDEEHKKLKEKLLDFGILRNMEIAELKKMIEQLMTENRKLIAEKELASHAPEDLQGLSVLQDGQITDDLLKEKQVLEDHSQAEMQGSSEAEISADRAALTLANRELAATVESLKETVEALQQNIAAYEADLSKMSGSLAASQEMISAFEQEEAILRSQLKQTTVERNDAKSALSAATAEIENLSSDKDRREEELQLKIREYETEISDLRGNIEELTSAIETKIQDSDDVHEKFSDLYEKLSARDIAMGDKMPELLEQMHTLSAALAGGTAGDSLFAKDFFHLNLKLSSLSDELSSKEALLREITDNYTRQKQEITAQLDAFAQARKDMLAEIDYLKKNVGDLTVKASASDDMLAKAADEESKLLRKMQEADASIATLKNENAALVRDIGDKNRDIDALQHELSQIAEGYARQKEEITALQDTYGQTQKELPAGSEDLKQEVAFLKGSLSASAEMLAAIGNEKEDLERRIVETEALNATLKNENTVLAENITVKNRDIETLQHDLARVREEYVKEEEAYQRRLSDMQEENDRLKQEVNEKGTLYAEVSAEFGREKDVLSHLAETHKNELSLREGEVERLKTEILDVQDKLAAHQFLLHDAQKEKTVLEAQLAGLTEQMQAVSAEREHLASLIADREQALSKAEGEARERKTALELKQQVLEEIEAKMKEERQVLDLAHSEKEALARNLLEYQEAYVHLKDEVVSLSKTMAEKEASIEALLLEKERLLNDIAGWQSAHEQSLATIRGLEALSSERGGGEAERLKNEVASLKKTITEKEAMIEVLRSEQERLLNDMAERQAVHEQSLASIRMLENLSTEKEAETNRLNKEVSSLHKTITEKEATIEALRSEQERLLNEVVGRQAAHEQSLASIRMLENLSAEKEAETNRLKDEIVSLNESMTEKQAAIEVLVAEKERLVNDIAERQAVQEQSLASIRRLEMLTAEKEREIAQVIAEKSDLVAANAEVHKQMATMQQWKENEIKTLKDDLFAYSRACADLGARLEQSIRDNNTLRSQALTQQEKFGETPDHFDKGQSITLPARVITDAQKKPSPVRHAFIYALFAALLIVGAGFALYAYNRGLIALPEHRSEPSSQKVVQQADFSYIDMLSLLTKSSASDNLKFQATLITEPLVLKSDDPAEASLFDFNKHLYFKITISSPNVISKDLTINPYPYVALTSGREKVKPLPDTKVKDIKAFYKKDDPVSVIFYCAFPNDILDAGSVSLSLSKENVRATLVWDLRALRTHNLIR